MDTSVVDREVAELQHQVKLLGELGADGKHSVAFGVLYEKTQDIFEALAGTLKAAKKRGVVTYDSPLLLKGAHDKIRIVLEKEA